MDSIKLAQKIAKKLNYGPGIIFLQGDMGAGKTTLSKAIIENYLKIPLIVTSPTYAYMNTYKSNINIYHFDLYRIEREEDIEELGLLEFINDKKSLRLIEWPEKALNYLPKPNIIVKISFDKSKRKANIN